MSGALAERRRVVALRRRAFAAADFPRNTCPASRHVHATADAIASGRSPAALEDDGALAHLGANMLAVVAALWEARAELRAARPRPPGGAATGAVGAALDRLDAAVSGLAAERDVSRAAAAVLGAEVAALRDRIRRAVAELDAAPDADPDKPSKRQTQALADANLRAWTVLTEGRDPPSRRRAEDAPRDVGGGA